MQEKEEHQDAQEEEEENEVSILESAEWVQFRKNHWQDLLLEQAYFYHLLEAATGHQRWCGSARRLRRAGLVLGQGHPCQHLYSISLAGLLRYHSQRACGDSSSFFWSRRSSTCACADAMRL